MDKVLDQLVCSSETVLIRVLEFLSLWAIGVTPFGENKRLLTDTVLLSENISKNKHVNCCLSGASGSSGATGRPGLPGLMGSMGPPGERGSPG